MPPEHLSDEDTELARLLYSMGRLPADQLSPLLERIRAQRTLDPSASLSGLLVSAGLVSLGELDQLREDSTETLLDSGQRPTVPRGSAVWVPGGNVAGYRLEADLGRGGMGVVMRARHQASGREVALKGLLQHDPETVERFTREIKALLAADGHPNVARVFDAGQADGQCYCAMELLPGGDLAQRLRQRNGLPPAEAARVVGQLARGLAHVHARGILHRDLKPQNVLFDAEGTPKLVDFGIVHVQGAKSLTQTGQVMGTPAYMAPEQALGVTELDERTDVYGLGAILYACLTGRAPFSGQLADVLTQVISSDPPRPSTVEPAVDLQLEAVCLRALAKQPERRYPNAVAFAEALEAWARGPEASSSSQRGVLLAVGALLLGTVAGTALGLGLATVRKPAPQPAPPLAATDPPPPTPAPDPPPEDEPEHEPELDRRPPLVAPQALVPGVQVMVPLDDSLSALALITGVQFEAGALTAEVSVMGAPSESRAVPAEGFHTDGFGVGTLVLTPIFGQPADVPSVVRRRVGPIALVEHPSGDRDWVPVSLLCLLDEGVAPPADDAMVQLAWSPFTNLLHPAVVLTREADLARVAYLNGNTSWIPADGLHPLPGVGARVYYQTADGLLPADLARAVNPLVVEVVVEGEGPPAARAGPDRGRPRGPLSTAPTLASRRPLRP